MVFVGLPIIWAAYGNQAFTRAALLVALLLPLNIISTIIALRIFKTKREKLDINNLLRGIFIDPIIIATIIGLIFSYLGLGLPDFIHDSLDIISGMTIAIALLSIGASFKYKHLKEDLKLVSFIGFNKLILVPVIVFLVTNFIFKISTIDRNVVVTMFAAPTAVSIYILAKELNSNHRLAASALILTTIISAITMPFFLLIFKFL